MTPGYPHRGSRHREQRVIAAVACPTCGAPRGEVCRQRSVGARAQHHLGRLTVCSARRTAWQSWKASRPVDVYVRGGTLLIATSDAAYTTLRQLAPVEASAELDAPRGLRVPPPLVGALVVALTQAGLHVA